MSEENVVRRNPKNNRRKNTDGYRTDSGCFEDVDLQTASRHSPTSDSPPSEAIVPGRADVVTIENCSEGSRHVTDNTDACPNSHSLVDECADDKDFHAILKRLAEITNNPGDLYRLCFSSRLSFCGHVPGGTDDEGSFIRTGEEVQDEQLLDQGDGSRNSTIPNNSESAENNGKRSSNGKECIELLSLLSSFMVKANENPNVFNHSSLGNSLVGQLSSLLSTLEEAKTNRTQRKESESPVRTQQTFPTNPQSVTPFAQEPAPECTGERTSDKTQNEIALEPEDSKTMIDNVDSSLNDPKVQHTQQSTLSNNEEQFSGQEFKTPPLTPDENTAFDGSDNSSAINPQDDQNRPSIPVNQTQSSNESQDFTSGGCSTFLNAEEPEIVNTSINLLLDWNKQSLTSNQRSDDTLKPKPAPHHNLKPNSHPRQNPNTNFKTSRGFPETNMDDDKAHLSLEKSAKQEKKRPLGLSQSEELKTPLLVTRPKPSFATTHFNTGICESDLNAKDPADSHKKQPLFPRKTSEFATPLHSSAPRTSQTSYLSTEIDTATLIPKDRPKNQRNPSLSSNSTEDAIPELNTIDCTSTCSSASDATDVVTSGRRAVKPYSWDYGDIWEKELERAKSTESFKNGGQDAVSSRKMDPAKELPSFEQIRDELFQNAGFFYDSASHADGAKRRSRSADARSTLQDDRMWSGHQSTQADAHSPFVRTVYQNEVKPGSGLRRSWSSHHIGGDSVMVNVDWTHGRHMRVITGSGGPYRGFDDVRAQIIKQAVVKTSTFRGPKPWSVLKRRPSGLRRRSAGGVTRNQSFHSSTSDESRESARAGLDHDSESSDSPYVSATSSDCLATATDDSSSVTSSQYYAASSLPSSPSVSNRNSACFSDTSTSDASDIRRVVFQNPGTEYVPTELYTRVYDTPKSFAGMSLDQRFGYIEKLERVSEPNTDLGTTSFKSEGGPLGGTKSFQCTDSNVSEGASPILPKKWQGDHLMSPLLVRSDSDLNRLTKVQFVGDSYSRSRISKNVRYTRNRSVSPPPVGPRSAHTRVVSCEIVESSKGKRDVYTKVNIAGSLNDEDAKLHDGRTTRLGLPSTRRSWHGQSPTRVSSLQPTNSRSMIPPYGARRHPGSLPPAQRGQVERAVHAKLVDIKGHQGKIRDFASTGSLRMSGSGKSRHFSDSVVTNAPQGYATKTSDPHPGFDRNFNLARNGNLARGQGSFGPPSDVGRRSVRQRLPPDYLTAVRQSQSLQRRRNQARFAGGEAHLPHTAFSNGHNSPVESNRFQTKPKEPIGHIVKETSFVGPSTFTKYQSSSNPSFSRTRRSRSLNEKDTMSRRRLCDSDVYRRRAIEMSQSRHNDSEYENHGTRCDSDCASARRPERRRRYSEGATRRPARHDGPLSGDVAAHSEGVVDVSYCDPHRQSIREGTYSIVNAESARNGAKSGEAGVPCEAKSRVESDVITRNIKKDLKVEEDGSISCSKRATRGHSNYNCTEVERRRMYEDRFLGESKDVESECKQGQFINGGKHSQVITETELPHGATEETTKFVREFHDASTAKQSNPQFLQAGLYKANRNVKSGSLGGECAVVLVAPPPNERMNNDTKTKDGFVDINRGRQKSGKCVGEMRVDGNHQKETPKETRADASTQVLSNLDERNLTLPSVSPYENVVEGNAVVRECDTLKPMDTNDSLPISYGTIDMNSSLPQVDAKRAHFDHFPIPTHGLTGNPQVGRTGSTTLPNEQIRTAAISSQLQHDTADGVVTMPQELPFTDASGSSGVAWSNLPYEAENKNCSIPSNVVLPVGQSTGNPEAVILAQELLLHETVESGPGLSSVLLSKKKDKASSGLSDATLPSQVVDQANTLTIPRELSSRNVCETNEGQSLVLSSKKKDSVVSEEVLPATKVGESDLIMNSPFVHHENLNADSSVVSSAVMANKKQAGENVILSPVLPNRRTNTNEVNVFIDYRTKRPVSVEYADEDVSFLKTLSSTTSRREKQNGSNEGKVKKAMTNKSCTAMDEGIQKEAGNDKINREREGTQRLSRRDRHEQEVLANKLRHLKNERDQGIPVSFSQPSPEPYRRDSTIVFTDARTSFGSDTDSISRDSTVSSSGSDMTVILHDEMDISADDLKQLTESGSKIGIEIAAIDVESGDDIVDGPNGTQETMPPAMELCRTVKHFPRQARGKRTTSADQVFAKNATAGNPRSSEVASINKMPKVSARGQRDQQSPHNLAPSSFNMRSSCSSIASSRASGKSSGTDSSKGKESSKNGGDGGKGFFSRLKNFRNSFRSKKSDGASPEKNGKKTKGFHERSIKENEVLSQRSEETSRYFVDNNNANFASKPATRKKSDARVSDKGGGKAQRDLSRRSYDVFRHPNTSLRSVVGVKSVSSDHLNAYRVNSPATVNEITAKSLEVLAETCI